MYQQLLCIAIEKIVAAALSLNSQGTEQLAVLEQKTLSISLAELGFELNFTVNGQQVLVTSTVDDSVDDSRNNNLNSSADCAIHTSIKTLIALKNEQQLTELIKQDKLDLQGDIKVAQQFAHIAETLDIDWRSELAKHIGDVATYKLESIGKNLANKLGFAARQIQADASEYLVHEQRLVVTSSQLSDFNHQVDQVTHQTEQAEQRIERLLTRLSVSSATAG